MQPDASVISFLVEHQIALVLCDLNNPKTSAIERKKQYDRQLRKTASVQIEQGRFKGQKAELFAAEAYSHARPYTYLKPAMDALDGMSLGQPRCAA